MRFCSDFQWTWSRTNLSPRLEFHTVENKMASWFSFQGVRMSQNSTKSLCMKFWLCFRSSSEGKYCMLSSCRRRLSSCRTTICPGGAVELCALGLSNRAPLAFSRTPRYESMSVSSTSLSELLPLSLPTESERMCSIWYFSCIKNWFVFLGARIPLALFPLMLTGRSDIAGLWKCLGWGWCRWGGCWWLRPLGHPPTPVLRPCMRPLQPLDQPCFLRLEGSLCGASLPSCCCCCCWQLLLHIISESIFLQSFLPLPPFLPAALLHIPARWPTQQQREAGFCFLAQITKDPPLSVSTFSLSFHFFSWPLALADASPALPLLAAAACLLGCLLVTPSSIYLISLFSIIWKSNLLLTALIIDL